MTTATHPPRRTETTCQPWCERHDHDADVVDDDSPPRHYGPEWRRFTVEALGDEKPYVTFNCDPGEDMAGAEFSVAELRKLAADALSAADWLEATRAAASEVTAPT